MSRREKVIVNVAMEPLGLPTEAAAAVLGLEPSTLDQMRVDGGGPEFKRIGPKGGKVVYTPDALRAWLATFSPFKNTTQADMAKKG